MKLGLVRKKSIIYSTTSSLKDSVNKVSSSIKLSKKEIQMDNKIKNLVNEIKQELAEGKKPEQISLLSKDDINEIISFILDKNALYLHYVFILNQFLYSFPFLEIFSIPENFMDRNDLFNKISLIFKKEQMLADKIIYLNGQLGKKFYMILEGKVTVINPIQFYVKATYKQFYNYLDFLLTNNEYELIKLCLNSNKKIVNEKIPYLRDKFYKYNELIDRNFNFDAKQEFTDELTYIDKFEEYINQNFGENSILTEAQKKLFEEKERKQEEEERKEKEKLGEIEEDEQDNPLVRRITGIDAENDKNEILDKIEKLERESIIHFYKIKPKKRRDKQKIFILWNYDYINTTLKNGDSFGEMALKKSDNKIISTIISKTNCLFCILERDEYRNLINEYNDNARRINVDSLMHSKMFYNYNSDLFNIHYFNYFTPIKKQKGDYLFRQKEKRKYIYFIKKGGVQIEYHSSWKDLDNILDTLTEQNAKIKKHFNDLIVHNESFESFIQKKQKFNIFVYFNGEIAGTNEILYPDTNLFMFDAVCSSECEIFSLEVGLLKNIISEKIIRKNYNELNIIKKDKLIKRLLNLKSNVINQYNRLVDSEDKQQTTEKTITKNNSLIGDRSRNTLTFKNNFLLSSSDFKKDIINFSPERKNIYKEYQALKLKNLEQINFRSTTKENNYFKMFKPTNENVKIYEEKKNFSHYLKTEKINNKKTHKLNISINFSFKGRVPKLLLNKVNTVNKVIDKLLSKEKDINNSICQKSNSKRFISHLDVLSFDNYMNKVESNFTKNKEEKENSREKHKKVKKLILLPISLSKSKYKNLTERKKHARKHSVF